MRILHDESTTYFIEVDLEIVSARDLRPLVDALGEQVCELHVGRLGRRYHARLEANRLVRDADAAIGELCRLIRALPPEARALWDGARVRDFDIGIQVVDAPSAPRFVLKERTVRAVAELGGRITATVYAPEKPSRRR
jgi:hypothetical protein